MNKYMFDTNIFNRILDGKIDTNLLKDRNKYLVTHIQMDEISNTRDEKRRQELMDVFRAVNQEKVLTESGVYGISKYGGGKYGGGDIFHRIRDELNKKEPKNQISNTRDALIAEVCIKNNYNLVTDDYNLYEVVKQAYGKVIKLDEFMREVGKEK